MTRLITVQWTDRFENNIIFEDTMSPLEFKRRFGRKPRGLYVSVIDDVYFVEKTYVKVEVGGKI